MMREEKLRLHITPFSPELAQSILSISSSLKAESISYHTLDTFPEHSYGYIELPAMEADRLKKKLNGSILKGKKLRIERARPEKRGFEPEDEKGDVASSTKEEIRPPKRSRKSTSELQAHQLTPDRKVKRGWTEPEKGKQGSSLKSSAVRSVASRHTDKSECLFRVQIPPNKESEQPGSTRNEKDRGTKKGKGATVVHEFENSVTQPSFIRTETGIGDHGVAAEYIDGKGWVDKEDNVLEKETKRQLRSRSRNEGAEDVHRLPKSNMSKTAQASSSVEHSNHEVKAKGRRHNDASIGTSKNEYSLGGVRDATEIEDESTSSSGTSSSDADSVSDSEEEGHEEQEEEQESKRKQEDAVPEPVSDSQEAGHPEKAEGTSEGTPVASPAVHPLEALFKRPSQAASQAGGRRPLEIKTTFNFFEPDEGQTMPQTPFTTHDLQLRGLRSAAPTPDTAHPTRRFFAESASPSSKSGNDEEADVKQPSDKFSDSKNLHQQEGKSDFANWFWEHRGENNRAWKRRRREAMKEKRQKENRQKGPRAG